MKYYVYVLKCPVINQVRYVGATKNPALRRKAHLCKRFPPNKNKMQTWLHELISAGLNPEFLILCELDTIEDAANCELAIYNALLPLGYLTNANVKKYGYRVSERKPRPEIIPQPENHHRYVSNALLSLNYTQKEILSSQITDKRLRKKFCLDT